MTDLEFPQDNGTWEPDPEVVTQRVEGETVLVHLETNEIYALNPTASRAWDLLATGIESGGGAGGSFSASSTSRLTRSATRSTPSSRTSSRRSSCGRGG